jgi:hypothetical protein
VAGGRCVQKTLLYLGEINDSEPSAWSRAIEAIDEREQTRRIHLFPEDRVPNPGLEHASIRLCLSRIELSRPRQWGGCWLAMALWQRLGLDEFWEPLLPASRKGTPWLKVLKTLVAYRLLEHRDELLLAIGAAKEKAGRNAHRLVIVHLPAAGQKVSKEAFRFELDRGKLRETRRHEGQYLLRSNLTGEDPEELWRSYMNLTRIEESFRTFKGDLGRRPIFHQLDGREVRMRRYTKPEKIHQLLLDHLGFTLPAQPPPEIRNPMAVVETF